MPTTDTIEDMTAHLPKVSSSSSWTLSRSRTRIAEEALGVPAWVMITRLFIGLGWTRAAVEKVIDSDWWNGTGIVTFIGEQSAQTLGWYRPVLDGMVAPNPVLFAVIVVVAEIAVAVSLLSGRAVGYGLLLGMFLNLNFLAAGAVNPSAFYLLSQGALALWLAEQVRSGKLITRTLSAIAIAAYVLGVMSLPNIGTLHPARVMADPGIMFVLVALLTVVACDLAHRRISGGQALPPLRWFSQRAGSGRRSTTASELAEGSQV